MADDLTNFLKKIEDLPPFPGSKDFTDDDIFVVVHMDPGPVTYKVTHDKLFQSVPNIVNSVPLNPDDAVGGAGVAFAIDDNYFYTKFNNKWGRMPRARTEQEWNNAQVKKGSLRLAIDGANQWNPAEPIDYSNIEEVYIYFSVNETPSGFKPPDLPFKADGKDPEVKISFRGENTTGFTDFVSLVSGVVTEVSLDTPPASPPSQFPVPPAYYGHFRVSLNAPLILNVQPNGVNSYYLTWEATQMLS